MTRASDGARDGFAVGESQRGLATVTIGRHGLVATRFSNRVASYSRRGHTRYELCGYFKVERHS